MYRAHPNDLSRFDVTAVVLLRIDSFDALTVFRTKVADMKAVVPQFSFDTV